MLTSKMIYSTVSRILLHLLSSQLHQDQRIGKQDDTSLHPRKAWHAAWKMARKALYSMMFYLYADRIYTHQPVCEYVYIYIYNSYNSIVECVYALTVDV